MGKDNNNGISVLLAILLLSVVSTLFFSNKVFADIDKTLMANQESNNESLNLGGLLSNSSFNTEKKELLNNSLENKTKVNINDFLIDPALYLSDKYIIVDKEGNSLIYSDDTFSFTNLKGTKLKADWASIKDFVTGTLIYNSDKNLVKSVLKNIEVNPINLLDFFSYVYNESSYFDRISGKLYGFYDQGFMMDKLWIVKYSALESCTYDLNKIKFSEQKKSDDLYYSFQVAKENFKKGKREQERDKYKGGNTINPDSYFCRGFNTIDNYNLDIKAANYFDYLLTDKEQDSLRYLYSRYNKTNEGRISFESQVGNAKTVNKRILNTKSEIDKFGYRNLSALYVAIFNQLGGKINDLYLIDKISYVSYVDKGSESYYKDRYFDSKNIYFDFKNKDIKTIVYLNKRLNRVDGLGFKLTGVNIKQNYGLGSGLIVMSDYPYYLIDEILARSIGKNIIDFNSKKPIIKLSN